MRTLLLTPFSLLFTLPAYAADVILQLPAGDGFVFQGNTGTTDFLRLDDATGDISREGAMFVHTTGSNSVPRANGALRACGARR